MTHLSSDLSTRLRFSAFRTTQPRFSGAQPAARVGALNVLVSLPVSAGVRLRF